MVSKLAYSFTCMSWIRIVSYSLLWFHMDSHVFLKPPVASNGFPYVLKVSYGVTWIPFCS